MASNFPGGLDDLNRPGLTHGDVTDALAAVETAVRGLLGTGGGPTGGRLLSGSGAPPSGATVEPLDGVNDPWQWSSAWGGWVRAWHVTWAAGAVIDYTLLPDDPQFRSGPSEPYADGAGMPFATVLAVTGRDPAGPLGPDDTYVNDAAGWRYADGHGAPFAPNPQPVAAAGTGTLLWVITEPGFTHTTVPAADFNPLPILASGFTVGAPYVWDAQASFGNDGDFYEDTSAPAGTLKLYGPKANGQWGDPLVIGPVVLKSPNGTAYRLIVADDGTLSTQLA